MSDEKNKVPALAGGVPIAKNPDEFNHMTPEQQAQLLYAHQATWLGKFTGASFANPSHEPIKVIDTEDRTAEEWRPSPEELIGTKDNSWK